MIGQLPPVHANAIAPFALPGRQPVGQETADLKNSSFKSLEEVAEGGYLQNRRLPDDRPYYPEEGRPDARAADEDAGGEQADRRAREAQQLQQDQAEIAELAARDREVRAHEQAHAAVGGQYAGSPVYTFVRGPDGVAYAVSGEVSISTSAVPGDPEATLLKARQIRRAAEAPAELSSQDRQVAAAAARMEAEALAQIMMESTGVAPANNEEEDESAVQSADRQATDENKAAGDDETKSAHAEAEARDAAREQWLALNRRLHDMGVWGRSASAPGKLFDSRV